MAEESNGAEALLDGMADELAGIVRTHVDALKSAPAVAEPAAVERIMKVVVAIGRANLMVRAVKAGEDKRAADKHRKLTQLEQMDMNDITPDELERRAAELRARADRILALIENKYGGSAVVAAEPSGDVRELGRDPKRRAA